MSEPLSSTLPPISSLFSSSDSRAKHARNSASSGSSSPPLSPRTPGNAPEVGPSPKTGFAPVPGGLEGKRRAPPPLSLPPLGASVPLVRKPSDERRTIASLLNEPSSARGATTPLTTTPGSEPLRTPVSGHPRGSLDHDYHPHPHAQYLQPAPRHPPGHRYDPRSATPTGAPHFEQAVGRPDIGRRHSYHPGPSPHHVEYRGPPPPHHQVHHPHPHHHHQLHPHPHQPPPVQAHPPHQHTQFLSPEYAYDLPNGHAPPGAQPFALNDDGLANGARAPISRTTRACDACRARKVRCSADGAAGGRAGAPCSRCRESGRECLYSSTQKKRGPCPGRPGSERSGRSVSSQGSNRASRRSLEPQQQREWDASPQFAHPNGPRSAPAHPIDAYPWNGAPHPAQAQQDPRHHRERFHPYAHSAAPDRRASAGYERRELSRSAHTSPRRPATVVVQAPPHTQWMHPQDHLDGRIRDRQAATRERDPRDVRQDRMPREHEHPRQRTPRDSAYGVAGAESMPADYFERGAVRDHRERAPVAGWPEHAPRQPPASAAVLDGHLQLPPHGHPHSPHGHPAHSSGYPPHMVYVPRSRSPIDPRQPQRAWTGTPQSAPARREYFDLSPRAAHHGV